MTAAEADDIGGNGRSAGIILIATTVLELLVLAHHPLMSAREIAQGGAAVAHIGTLNAWVHGVLIALLLTWYYCLTEFSRLHGLHRPAVRIGLIAYSAGVAAMVGAALVDGFVVFRVPATVATLIANGALPEPSVGRQLLVLEVALNQALADFGLMAMSAAVVAWSLALIGGGRCGRLIACAGLLVGLAPAAALVTGMLHLDKRGILTFCALQALWNLAIGTQMAHRPGSQELTAP